VTDYSNTFMNAIKARAMARIAANDERRQVLNSRVIWDEGFHGFEDNRNNVEGHYGKIGTCYFLSRISSSIV
jgi:hypothetical protein